MSRRSPATRSCRRRARTCSRGSAAPTEARAEFERAAELSANQRQARFLRRRAAAC